MKWQKNLKKRKKVIKLINWKVRLKNKLFWLAIVPAFFLLAQQVLKLAGIDMDFSQIQEDVLAIINTVFEILVIIGVVTDPTTDGMNDSERALTYTRPYKTDADIAA